MCYLIAKDTKKHGCLALKTRHGSHLVQLVTKLDAEVGRKGVQLVTISRPTAWNCQEKCSHINSLNFL